MVFNIEPRHFEFKLACNGKYLAALSVEVTDS